MAAFYDELVGADGEARPHARTLVAALEALGPEALTQAGRRRDAIFMQQGITFDAGGPGSGTVKDRPFPLDLVPRIIPADEWTQIKRGLAQRIRALNHFVDDVYHAREIIHDGKVPWQLVVSRPAFARAAHGIRPPGGVYCHVSGCDLVRDGNGAWKVLEDNVRTPSGISYVLENRRAMTRLLPALFEHYRVRPVDHYPALLRTALEEVAPTGGEEEATVVVWTPGPYNSAYFEHAFLARQMGVELVEASDLVVRDAVCHIRTTRGLQRVHAIYRRIDDDFMDPLEFRPGLRARRPGADARLPGGERRDRQRGRHRRRRRQGDLPLRPGDDPLLPRRGADHRERPDLPDVRPRAARVGAGAARPGRGQADERIRRQGRVHRAGARPRRSSRRRRRRSSACRRSWIAQDLVHLSTVPTAGPDGALGAAARRSAAVRGLRRRHPDRPGRAHPRRAARGLDDRQLLPGRRLEGHVGARGGDRRARPSPRPR